MNLKRIEKCKYENIDQCFDGLIDGTLSSLYSEKLKQLQDELQAMERGSRTKMNL